LPAIDPIYDEAGNLEFDHVYYYQYDAWNRLVQVNLAEWDELNEEPVINELVKHYTYDGFGRLVRTTSPFPDPLTSPGHVRTERFYYDGVRRVLEIVTDPVPGLGMAMESGDPELEAIAAASTSELDPDETGTPMMLESSGPGGGAPASRKLSREYVWGPGDNGLDELLASTTSSATPGGRSTTQAATSSRCATWAAPPRPPASSANGSTTRMATRSAPSTCTP